MTHDDIMLHKHEQAEIKESFHEELDLLFRFKVTGM